MELIKQNSQIQIIKSLLVIFLGSVLLAISAKIKIPFFPLRFLSAINGQTLSREPKKS